MTAKERYESAKALYASIGVDTDKAIETLKSVPVDRTIDKFILDFFSVIYFNFNRCGILTISELYSMGLGLA